MLLSDLANATRLDLFDPTGPNQRWSDSDLDRAIDKAVERYSQYYPNIVYTDLNTSPLQRTYPYPRSWNAAYPLWWLERIFFPLQAYGSYFAPPLLRPLARPSLALASTSVATNMPLASLARAVRHHPRLS